MRATGDVPFRDAMKTRITASRNDSAVNYDKEEDGRWRRRRCDDGGGEDVGSPERQGRIGGFHVSATCFSETPREAARIRSSP